ncbi:MAG: PKD domain-containing protein, partial [Bacteroidota bacterium]
SLQTIVVGNTLGCNANFAIYPDSTQMHTYIGVNLATGNGPLSYTWTWGDGTSSTGPYPSHTYVGPGTYTICLYISDSQGCVDTACYSFALLRLQGGAPITINVLPSNTGISETSGMNSIRLFPVPATDRIQIQLELNQSDDLAIRLIDITGRVLQTLPETTYAAGKNTVSMNLENILQGVYVVEVIGKSFQSQETIIIK